MGLVGGGLHAYLCSPVLEAALQALDLANLDLNLPAQLLVLGGEVLEVRCALVRVLQQGGARKKHDGVNLPTQNLK